MPITIHTLLAVTCAALATPVHALDNGVARTPAMGFSSWNAFSSNVTEHHMKAIVSILQGSGLARAGYEYVNVDEGWLKGRDNEGNMLSDRVKFPSGMRGFGDWVHGQARYDGGPAFKYGLYTCRGTCQCSTQWYHGPGSHGYEAQDVDWMVKAGADYLKVDSCCASQDHATAFAEYALFRDALNATGRPVWFNLCGWHDWYAPPDPALNYSGGASLGNSWRIAGDGRDYNALSNCMNTFHQVAQYGGPGGWNDPDLLIGPNVLVGGQTDEQARTQFSVWCVMGAPLIISVDLRTSTQYALDTYNNTEAIAVNQDALGVSGQRLVGGNLTFPCTGTTACTNVWGRPLATKGAALAFVNNGNAAQDVTCDAACFAQVGLTAGTVAVRDLWAHKAVATLTAPFTFTSTATPAQGGSTLYTFTPSA